MWITERPFPAEMDPAYVEWVIEHTYPQKFLHCDGNFRCLFGF